MEKQSTAKTLMLKCILKWNKINTLKQSTDLLINSQITRWYPKFDMLKLPNLEQTSFQ